MSPGSLCYHPAAVRRGDLVRRFAWLVMALAGLAAVRASANPLDNFGYTSRLIGMGGAGTAAAGTYDAAYYNPAGLGLLNGTELGIGVQLYRPFLKATTHALDTMTGRLEATTADRAAKLGTLYDIGLASPIPLGKGLDRVLFVGLNVVVPGTTLYEIRERPRNEAYFPFLEDRNRRLVLNAAVAARWKWAMLGVGLSMLPDVTGRVTVDFRGADGDNRVDVDVGAHVSPNVGLLFEPVQGLLLGVTWRGANRTYLELPVSMTVSGGSKFDARVVAYDWSTPHELAIGASWNDGNWLVTGDLTVSFFRQFRQSSPSVVVGNSAGGAKSPAWEPAPALHDAVTVRVGGEYRVLPALLVRAGFGYQQSPVPAQTDVSNLLDGDRLTGSVGLGFDASGVGGPPIDVDVHFAGTGLLTSRSEKTLFAPENPGYPWVEGSGWILNAGLSAKVRF